MPSASMVRPVVHRIAHVGRLFPRRGQQLRGAAAGAGTANRGRRHETGQRANGAPRFARPQGVPGALSDQRLAADQRSEAERLADGHQHIDLSAGGRGGSPTPDVRGNRRHGTRATAGRAAASRTRPAPCAAPARRLSAAAGRAPRWPGRDSLRESARWPPVARVESSDRWWARPGRRETPARLRVLGRYWRVPRQAWRARPTASWSHAPGR